MAETNIIRKRVLGDLSYQPALLREIRNYYRDKYELVSKKAGINDNVIQYHWAGDEDTYRCLSIDSVWSPVSSRVQSPESRNSGMPFIIVAKLLQVLR